MEEYSNLTHEQMLDILEYLHDKYNRSKFIEADPISVPHSFSRLEDQEIAGFLASTIAWGNRKAIVKSAHRMMDYMDRAPYDFVTGASNEELDRLLSYVHRTFNGRDFRDFVLALRGVCLKWGSLGELFQKSYEQCGSIPAAYSQIRREFFSGSHDSHCEKHFSSIDKGAACKRINMFVRWFVRKDSRGVDFGAWNRIPQSEIFLPLDVHTGNMGRALGLLKRKQSDWKATEEITARLRLFDPQDPVKYDFSLFGAGIDGFLKK